MTRPGEEGASMPQGYGGHDDRQRWHPPNQAAGWQQPQAGRRNPRDMSRGVPEQFGPRAQPRSVPRYYQPSPSQYGEAQRRPRVQDAGPRWTHQQPQQPAPAPRYQAPARQPKPAQSPKPPLPGPARASLNSAAALRRSTRGQLPRYPRFPRLLPRSRRGPSVFRVIYFGTHPVAMVMSMLAWCILIEVWILYAALAVMVWLCHCGIVAVQRAAQG